MRIAAALMITLIAGTATATLPPLSDEAKARAAEAAARSAWADKVGLYQLCLSMDRTAEAYRQAMKAGGKEPPAATATAACVNPGPYVAQAQVTPLSSKPLEAAGAHSPPGVAISPPNTNTPGAELTKGAKP